MKKNCTQYFIISDIHGRVIDLESFVDKGFDPTNPNDEIVILGDFFDRYSGNMKVLEFIEDLYSLIGDRLTLLKGNHDEFLELFIKSIKNDSTLGEVIVTDPDNLERWLRNGGDITIEQLFGSLNDVYSLAHQERLKRLNDFVCKLKLYYETDNYIFTHACIDENREVDLWNRDFIHRGMECGKTIFIGHTPHKYLIEENCELIPFGTGIVGRSRTKTACPVYNIDNGEGNNIIVLKGDVK